MDLSASPMGLVLACTSGCVLRSPVGNSLVDGPTRFPNFSWGEAFGSTILKMGYNNSTLFSRPFRETWYFTQPSFTTDCYYSFNATEGNYSFNATESDKQTNPTKRKITQKKRDYVSGQKLLLNTSGLPFDKVIP